MPENEIYIHKDEHNEASLSLTEKGAEVLRTALRNIVGENLDFEDFIIKKTEEALNSVYLPDYDFADSVYIFIKDLTPSALNEIKAGIGHGLSYDMVSVYADPKFYDEQMREMRDALEHGLAIEQTGYMARRELDPTQMHEIRLGFEHGLSTDQIMGYCSYELPSPAMEQIRLGFEQGLSFDQVALYATSNLNASQMSTLRTGLLRGILAKERYAPDQITAIRQAVSQGLGLDDISLFSDTGYNGEQMEEISAGISDGLTRDPLSIYADKKFSAAQMKEIRLGIEDGLSTEQIRSYADPEISPDDMYEIRSCYKQGITPEQMDICMTPGLSLDQREEIRQYFAEGFTVDQVRPFASPIFTPLQMQSLRYGLEYDIPVDTIMSYITPDFDDGQIYEICRGIKAGLSKEDMMMYADTKFNSEQMRFIRMGFEEGLTRAQIRLYASPEITYKQMDCIFNGLTDYDTEHVRIWASPDVPRDQMLGLLDMMAAGATTEQLKIASGKAFADKIDIAVKCLKYGLTDSQMEKVASGGSRNRMSVLMEGFRRGIPKERLRSYLRDFDDPQLGVIKDMISHNLPKEKMDIIAQPEIDSAHMQALYMNSDNISNDMLKLLASEGYDAVQVDIIVKGRKKFPEEKMKYLLQPGLDRARSTLIYTAIVAGIPDKYLKLLADPRFNSSQATVILDVIREGFSEDEIRTVADRRYSGEQMKRIAYGISEGFTDEQKALYMNPELDEEQMDHIQEALSRGVLPKVLAPFVDPKFSAAQMFYLTKALAEDVSPERLASVADTRYDPFQTSELIFAIKDGLTDEQIDMFRSPDIEYQDMHDIHHAIRCAGYLEMRFETGPDSSIDVTLDGDRYHATKEDLGVIRERCYGISPMAGFMYLAKFEQAKGRKLDFKRDASDLSELNAIIHTHDLRTFLPENRDILDNIAKESILGRQYYDSPAYSREYMNTLTNAFKSHCHGFVPKVIETIAMVGEHMGQDPDDIAEHFNVRVMKQMLRNTNNWVQAYIGMRMPPDDRNRFLSSPYRENVTKLICKVPFLYDKGKAKDQAIAAAEWILRHPTASKDLVDSIETSVSELDIDPDMTSAEIFKQTEFAKGAKDVRDIESDYGIKLSDMEFNIRHSYIVNKGNGQIARTLLKGEEREMVALGDLTCCCQRLGDAGETAMMYGLIHPEAGFWVIESKEGKVLAQAEIWEPYKDHNTIVFDNIEFANDRDISTVIDTLVQWCKDSRYENVIMGTGYNEIRYEQFPEAPINHQALSKTEIAILEAGNLYIDDHDKAKESDYNKAGIYFVKDDDDPYVYSDALDKCVYLKKNGHIPEEVMIQCGDRYRAEKEPEDQHASYVEKDDALNERYRLAELLSDARIQLRERIPDGYKTFLDVNDDKCTICLYKGEDTNNKIPFADISRNNDGSLDIEMCQDSPASKKRDPETGTETEDPDIVQ